MAEKATQTAKVPAVPAPARRGPVRLRGTPPWPLERELETLFDDLRRRLHWPALSIGEGRFARGEAVAHAFDVFEQGDEVVIKAELPGIKKDELEISLDDSTLTVRGEKRRDEEHKEGDYTYSERSFGLISRTVELPSEVKPDQAKATLKDGVLEIRIPKSEAAKQRTVKVKVQ